MDKKQGAEIEIADEVIEYKYKIRERFLAFSYERRCNISRQVRNKFRITDTTWYRWRMLKIADTAELSIDKLKYIASLLGCTWIDLLNDEWRDSLSLND